GGSNTVDATITASQFTSNTQMGIQVQDTASFTNLTVGDLAVAANGNTFTGNHGAGIFYKTTGSPLPTTTHSAITIANNTITGTLRAPPPAKRRRGTGLTLNSIKGTSRNIDVNIGSATGGNTITGNASDGIHLEVHNSVNLTTAVIDNNTIGTLASPNAG